MQGSPNNSQRMLTYDDLVNDMASGCKPRSQWKVGIEHEQFLFRQDNEEPLPYEGSPGIRQVLENFADDYGWQGIKKNGNLIELRRDGASITLEPGGQIELSGAPYKNLQGVKDEADRYYAELKLIAEKLGLGIMAKGFHPQWSPNQIHWMPKERYKIMGPYMSSKSRHGVDMMIRTCGAQINMDFDREADMIKKYRVGLALQPIVTALMANSSQVEGKDSGYKTYRSFIWTETDPDRCGVPEFIFKDEMSFSRYVDYALDVPMYFIMRAGHHVNVAGQSFRNFMEGQLKGHEGDFPDISDWHDHLTTLFPEVRLKTYLEFRGPDSAEAEIVYAMAAFWAGILYDEDALSGACTLIEGLLPEDHVRIRNDVPRLGLNTPVKAEMRLYDMAAKALSIAKEGLSRYEPDAAKDLLPFDLMLRNFA
ncbi:MAG: glutamate--cysteine ligase [Micavibrio aeruginosavorus]|uniref:Glutamate--cysteine ligase n=1 Tax=Micavibrio aeruginosavorus TaxID=349221 RepID=A0A2W5HIZ9_9BACT|nr:MAG: glutamate--cysteine ligase [Micavibrio aeruginosavorus]